MFTNGQKTRMLAALNSNTAERDNLWSDENLEATGTSDTPNLCMAAFNCDQRNVANLGSGELFHTAPPDETTEDGASFRIQRPRPNIEGRNFMLVGKLASGFEEGQELACMGRNSPCRRDVCSVETALDRDSGASEPEVDPAKSHR